MKLNIKRLLYKSAMCFSLFWLLSHLFSQFTETVLRAYKHRGHVAIKCGTRALSTHAK